MTHLFMMMSCLSNNFYQMFDLMTDMVFEHTFPEDELNSKKEQLINILISLQDEGSYLAERVFKTELYKIHRINTTLTVISNLLII